PILADRKVVWINVDGVCKFRACRIKQLDIIDDSISTTSNNMPLKTPTTISQLVDRLQSLRDSVAYMRNNYGSDPSAAIERDNKEIRSIKDTLLYIDTLIIQAHSYVLDVEEGRIDQATFNRISLQKLAAIVITLKRIDCNDLNINES